MKLLIFTQKVDKNDSTLGFFHTWINEFSKKVESVTVICLKKGDFDLPKNVSVYSLGKERGVTQLGYLKNLYQYIFLIRGSYDKVFVHMNQEYVILLGIYWKLKGIPVYLWRNHPDGSFLTRIAVLLSTKLFCTSNSSFTARFNKVVIMPAGIDTGAFKPSLGTVRKKYSVCMVGRISPIKHVELAIEAIEILVSSGAQVSLTVVGPTLPRDLDYGKSLEKDVSDKKLSAYVQFFPGVSPDKLPEIYSSHEVCLNFTDSGSFDKTIVEAASCGCIPLVSNKSLQTLIPDECFTDVSPDKVAESIQKLLNPHNQLEIQKKLESFVNSQSLDGLTGKLFIEMQ